MKTIKDKDQTTISGAAGQTGPGADIRTSDRTYTGTGAETDAGTEDRADINRADSKTPAEDFSGGAIPELEILDDRSFSDEDSDADSAPDKSSGRNDSHDNHGIHETEKNAEDTDNLPSRRGLKRAAGLAGGIAAAALAVVYLLISLFFIGRFLPRSFLNGRDVSARTAAQTEAAVYEDSQSYSLTLKGREGIQGTISASDIALHPNFDGSIAQLVRQRSPFLWPLALFSDTEYVSENTVYFDEELLDDALHALPLFDPAMVRAPVDAALAFENGQYIVKSEDPGTTLLDQETTAAVKTALLGLMDSLDLEEAGCYEAPAIRSDDPKLVREAGQLNTVMSANLHFQFGSEEENLSSDVFRDWISLDADGTPVIDREAVESYVAALSKRYDSFGTSRRFRTSRGEDITISAGSYGWWMDQSATADLIENALLAGTQAEISPVYFGEAAAYGEADWGDSYVEIDLDAQHVWCYADGSLAVEADCVSGNAARGNGTPAGIYPITYKERNATLVGENYASDVSYWMPFNGNVGMHDAPWRRAFGGSIYLTSGSHGCINLPVSAASVIFEHVKKGEAVIVYGGASQAEAQAAAARTAPAQPVLTPAQQVEALTAAAMAAQQAAADAAAASNADPENAELRAAADQAMAAADQAVLAAQQAAAAAAAAAGQ